MLKKANYLTDRAFPARQELGGIPMAKRSRSRAMSWCSRQRAAQTRGDSARLTPNTSRLNSLSEFIAMVGRSEMRRRARGAFWVNVTMACILVCPAGASNASPTDDDGSGQCTFVLTPPKVTQAYGLSLVVAVLRPGPCTMHASPNSSVVCLSVAGQGSPGECASQNGPSPAEVRYPYQPGTTYVVKGQGCASTFKPPYTLCQNFGPTQIAL